MKVVVKRAGQMPETKEIENELHALQEIVGGHIETFPMFDDVLCVCNEDGKGKDLPFNFIFARETIVGDVFFCKAGYKDFESLDEDEVKFFMDILTILEKLNAARNST